MIRLFVLASLIFSLPIQVVTVRYNYSYYGQVVHSAPGMTFATFFNAQTLGTNFQSPEDMVIYNNQIYILDTLANQIVLVSDSFELISVHNQFPLSQAFIDKQLDIPENGFVDEVLSSPRGIDVTESGIYIADTNNNRILKLNHAFEVLDIFDQIEDQTFDEMPFEPLKITVDVTNRMYVVARNVYEGIIEINSDGTFNRFTGVNPIRLTPVEIFTRSLMSEAQIEQLRRFLPTEYTNVNINERNFIYATSRPSENNAEDTIQLINPKGLNVIKKNGYHSPMGDIHFIEGLNSHVITGPSLLVDIANTSHGKYTVLDQKRSRLFTYDSEGNLLYVNGDEGSQNDKFSEGVAIAYLGDDLLVLDRKARNVVVYRLTEFGASVNQAVAYHEQGQFNAAADIWREAIKLNTNYEIAYNGIGKYLLREGRFEEAMTYFKLGHDQYYYSKAFRSYRNEIIRENFSLIMGSIIIVTGSFIGYKVYKTYKKGGSILYED